MNTNLKVCEIFHSIQGETSLAGVRFAFIRLSGCNLRCNYCDTKFAYDDGTEMSIEDICNAIKPFQTKHVLITGGEPLLQPQTPRLVRYLQEKNYQISIETNGETPIADVSSIARIVMDIKTPGSGMCRGGYENNLRYLKATDEVKFVITSKEDYEWAKKIVAGGRIPTHEILFSPALQPDQSFSSSDLADAIIHDKLPVRFQLQLHKVLWNNTRQK